MYEPASGRFDGLDPYAGNSWDPQSYNKYLYTHADPVNNSDPTGMMSVTGTQIAIGVSAIIGGSVGSYIGYSRGGLGGAILGAAIGAIAAGSLTNYALPAVFEAAGAWGGTALTFGSGLTSGVVGGTIGGLVFGSTVNSRYRSAKIAIVGGDLGPMYGPLFTDGLLPERLAQTLKNSGFTNVTYRHKPNEQEFVDLLNENEHVFIVAHGDHRFASDQNGTPFTGIRLGGSVPQPTFNEGGVPIESSPEWIVPADLAGKIHNDKLRVYAACCFTARSNAFLEAIDPQNKPDVHYVGFDTLITSGDVARAWAYFRTILEDGKVLEFEQAVRNNPQGMKIEP